MQMNTGFDSSMIDQYMTTAKQEEEDDELEIERKYYKKPQTNPIDAMPFLQAFVQGM